MTLKRFTIDDIRSWDPCYDPEKYLPEDWEGNVLDILDIDAPFGDLLWVVLRRDFVSEKLMRLFAVWCARQVQHLMNDNRSLEALEVAERYANGLATKDELAAAWEAARDAAWDAARGAARAAALAAARAAAWDAARAAAWDAALAAAWEAARDADWEAARDADWEAALEAARDARDAKKNKLEEMIKVGIKTGDVVLERTTE